MAPPARLELTTLRLGERTSPYQAVLNCTDSTVIYRKTHKKINNSVRIKMEGIGKSAWLLAVPLANS